MKYQIICKTCGHTEVASSVEYTTIKKEGWRCWGSNSKTYENICESTDCTFEAFPEDGDDVKVLRAEYNRRHADEPGFVPSVEYVTGPDGKTRPRES